MGVFVIEESDSVCVCVGMTGCLCAGYNPGTILRTTKDSGNRQILLIRFAAVVEIHHPGANPEKETALSTGDLRAERWAGRNPSLKLSIEITVKL